MQNKSWLINLIIFLLIFVVALIVFPYFKPLLSHETHTHSEVEHVETAEEFKRGAHRGRVLQSDNFQVEVTIFEPEGVPPKFRIYFYDNGVPIQPSEVKYKMILERINRVENIPFKEEAGYLESTIEASEPHSFKVKIQAEFKEKKYEWEYASYEGRVELTPEAIRANSIKIEKATSVELEVTLNAMGKVMPNEEFTVYISPRFPGVVKSVNKKLGDHVQKGDTLAVIESNESLQNYEIKSEINGMIIKRNINIGMYLSGQENIFVISDLQTVWADFNIYQHDLPLIKIGDVVEVKSLDGHLKGQSTISYISPLGHESTQSVVARAVLSNSNELWKPGLFISGDITVDKIFVPVAIKDRALQTFKDSDVVFISVGNFFEIVPVKLGRRNKEWVEVVSGLSSGDNYVSQNSFILKADLEKSGAIHEH
jgi:cobalt-zinc-cadmium efflux system membrane fusion protein